MAFDKKIILLLLLGLLLGGGLLIYSISLDDVTYYHGVNEVLAEPEKFSDNDIRVLGLVQPGSVIWDSNNLMLSFEITEDGNNFLAIDFQGVKPDLFQEGQGVIVEGRFNEGFKAHNLLVKHSSEYRANQHITDKSRYYKSILQNF